MRAALMAPERVNGLVLMSTQPAVDSAPLLDAYREMRDTWKQIGPVQPLLEGLATAILGPRDAPGIDSHWNKWLPKWKELTGESIYHAMNNLLERDEITPRLAEIVCPVLVTHGANDSAIPVSVGENLSRMLPNCLDFVVAPGAHAVNLTHAHVINPSLKRFLDTVCV